MKDKLMLACADNKDITYVFTLFGKSFLSIDNAFLYFTLDSKERTSFYHRNEEAKEYIPSYEKKKMSDSSKKELLSLIVKERIVQNISLVEELLNSEIEDYHYSSSLLNDNMSEILYDIQDSLAEVYEVIVDEF